MREKISRRDFLKKSAIAGAGLTVVSAGGASIGASILRAAELRLSVDPAALKKFSSTLQGRLITALDPAYDAARHIWNTRYDKHPAAIVQCATTDDVVRSIDFARSNKLAVAVRSGGHDQAGFSTCEGGMVIDLGSMKAVSADAEKKTVSAQPGVRVGELYRALEAKGLATPSGACPSVGIGGLTLGGGEGALMGKYGIACDNVTGAELVTGDGKVLRVDADHDPDLFWAIRGGSGNFGVVTNIVYRAYPVDKLLAGTLIHPIEEAANVLRNYRDFTASAPDEVTTAVVIGTLTAAQPLVAISVCYSGKPEDGERVLKPLRSFGPPVKDTVKLRRLSEAMLIEGPEPDMPSYQRGGFIPRFDLAAINAITLHLDYAPLLFQIGANHLHGATCRGDSAFPLRRPGLDTWIAGFWRDNPDELLAMQWVNRAWAAVGPLTDGVYVNELEDEGDLRVRAAYGASYDRLVAVKTKYDPTNFFHLNQNIQPTAPRPTLKTKHRNKTEAHAKKRG